jgi:hypothetical protein
MPKKDIRKSVNWVQNFKITQVKGEPDLLHNVLYDLEKLVIAQLPFTDSKIATAYNEKIEAMKNHKIEQLFLLAHYELLERYLSYSKITLAHQELILEIFDHFSRVEEGQSEGGESDIETEI